MLTISQLSYHAGSKALFDEASVHIKAGHCTGLIGRNGAGKSTLINLIQQALTDEHHQQIQCDISPEHISHLAQSLPQTQATAIEFVKTGDHAWIATHDALQAAQAREDGMAIANAYARLQEIDGYTIDARAAIILQGLGFSQEAMQQSVQSFSGGWQMRLQLARTLLSRAELLLLDEPTNHLDLEATAWLEQWLLKQSANVILISHDRDFLDTVCSQILHLSQLTLTVYPGNYTNFTQQYELKLENQAREQAKIERQKAHMQTFVDRFRFKASKAKQAQSRIKAIEKLTLAPALLQENPFQFSFLSCDSLGSPILKIEGDGGYGSTCILKRINISVSFDDRIALIGLNGAGKSTLIKTLVGELPLLKGERTAHTKLNIGYYSQQQVDALTFDNNALQHLLTQDPSLTEAQARRYLGQFDFQGQRVFDPVSKFSGGEKARLALALLIHNRPNILLLDEPTNHLDIQMREALILALQAYEGAIILVSHDRHFINSTVNTLWLVKDGHVQEFKGNLDEYQATVLDDSHPPTSTCQPVKPKKTKQTHKTIATQLDKLERSITQLTNQRESLLHDLSNPTLYQSEYTEKRSQLQSQLDQVESKIAAQEKQWINLAGDV